MPPAGFGVMIEETFGRQRREQSVRGRSCKPCGSGNFGCADPARHGPANGSKDLADAANDLGTGNRFTHVYIMDTFLLPAHNATNFELWTRFD